jgi:exonuclease, DNA polymerase III, epsilon subunit family
VSSGAIFYWSYSLLVFGRQFFVVRKLRGFPYFILQKLPRMTKLFDLLSENSNNDKVISSLKKIAKKNKNTRSTRSDFPDTNATRYAVPGSGVFDFVAIDVETTGLDHKNDRIIEIGAIKFTAGKPGAEFSTLINPGVPLPAAITQLTGIQTSDLDNAPVFDSIAGALVDFMANLPLCGHQIEFDIGFLNEEFKRTGRPKISAPDIDTALLSRIVVPSISRFSLKHMSRSLGIELENAHRALADARASGYAAIALIARLNTIPPPVRLAMARFAPASLLKTLIFSSLDGDRSFTSADPPIGALQKPPKKLAAPASVTALSLDTIQHYFSSAGKLSEIMKGFVERPSQTRMAVCVAEALNTATFLVAEAGTGTGKSLAYLLPSACFALKNGVRILVSTHTRNLQDQLMSKDIPVVKKVTGEDLRYCVLKGRLNYLCIHRYRRLLSGELADLSYRERMGMLPLIRWAQETKTGDIEEQNQFNIRWFSRIWRQICADAHLCKGKRCPDFASCFLQNARQRANGSHLVIINHSLFFSEICSESSFLGSIGPIIFDEAHHLESCGHQYLRVEVDTNRFTQFLDTMTAVDKEMKKLEDRTTPAFSAEKDFKSIIKHMRSSISVFLDDVNAWAGAQAPASPEYQLEYVQDTFSLLGSRAGLLNAFSDMQDKLYHLLQSFGPDEAHDTDTASLKPALRLLSDRTSQLKADFDYVTGAVTEGHVFWIEGNLKKGWTKLCGVPLDIGSLLSGLWEKNSAACIFTSATLSVSRSMEYFKQKTGLTGMSGEKTRCEFFESPFSPDQALRGAMRSAPACDAPEYPDYVANVISVLISELKKNILVLFTANAMLNAVHARCKDLLTMDSCTLLAQGITGNRQAVLDEFKNSGRAVLLGTDSFWEGIDVPGKACEIVIIPRLPFQVPTHPLTRALSQKMEKESGESFFSYTVPEAIIKFRQGTGRLIRSREDRGALIVLDNRILTKNYGKRFRTSLEGEMQSFSTIDELLLTLKDFFANGKEPSPIAYVPFEEPS